MTITLVAEAFGNVLNALWGSIPARAAVHAQRRACRPFALSETIPAVPSVLG